MKTRLMILSALFAALTAAGAWIRIPIPPAAISLQFLFTAMAGILLGWKYGTLSQAVYVILGLAGLPIFTLGGGIGYVLQPSFGFILGLVPAAAVMGLVTRQHITPKRIALACVAGLGVIYLLGLIHMVLILNVYLQQAWPLSKLLWSGMLIFLPGDALKTAACCLICPRLAVYLDKMHQSQL